MAKLTKEEALRKIKNYDYDDVELVDDEMNLKSIDESNIEEEADGYLEPRTAGDFCWESKIILQELVERATPKKLVATSHTRRCPSCNRQMSGINNAHPNRKFCSNCGQALDWR